MDETFSLNCAILGDVHPDRTFTVKATLGHTIYTLKEAIKDEIKFDHIATRDVAIWKASHPKQKYLPLLCSDPFAAPQSYFEA